jgi:hypothetical protein
LGTYSFIRKAEETRRHRIIKGSDSKEAVTESFRGLLNLLTYYGLPIKSHESAIAYAERLKNLSPLGVMQLKTCAEIFSRAKFSQIEITTSDADFLRKNYFFMYNKLKRDERMRFFVHRYLKNLK